ncbi:MAG: hypothetical protein JW818_20755 [Pirellulales bacterium]|nr:hypothetical protein [Pirellulales bacterium]
MLNVFVVFSALVLVVSGGVHLAGLCRCDVRSAIPQIWILHVLALVAFAGGVYYINKVMRDPEQDQGRCILAAPKWIIILAGILFVYAGVNFMTVMMSMEGNVASRESDGSFALTDHGQVVRELSEDEYHLYRSCEVRAMSGHWMFFSALALVFLTGAKRWSNSCRSNE